MPLNERLEASPAVMGGVMCVRGTRIPVVTIVRCVADGMTPQQIIEDFPRLTAEDIAACMEFAVASVQERYIPLRPTGS